MDYRQKYGGNYESTFNHNNLGMSNASRGFNKPSFRCIFILIKTIHKNTEALVRFNLCFKMKDINLERLDKSYKLI